MAFFQNRTINLLNLHYIVSAAAQGGGGAFMSAYLLRAGMSVPLVLLSQAAIFGVRFGIRMMVLSIGIRIGLRKLLLIGTAIMAACYPILIGVHGVGWNLAALVVALSFADAFYWPSYHAYFAVLGDAEHRGSQVGVREAVNSATGIVSPLLAGWLLVAFGPAAAFWATAAIQASAAIPLIWTPDVAVARSAPGAFRAALSGAMMFVADGWIASGYFIVWQIALFVSLDRSYLAYGGALAVTALVGSVAGLFLGRLIDSGKGGRAVWLAIGTTLFVIALRAISAGHPTLAVIANAFGALVNCLYIPTLMTAVYNNAKRSPCVLRYHIIAEGGWDADITTGLLAAAAITAAGLNIGYAVATASIGALTVFVLLRRYYAAHESETIDASLDQAEDAKI
jgi:MFS transporter, DHA1 family, inner membrane transport protein